MPPSVDQSKHLPSLPSCQLELTKFEGHRSCLRHAINYFNFALILLYLIIRVLALLKPSKEYLSWLDGGGLYIQAGHANPLLAYW